jgi:putative membrane protein insertion efficiency factor
MSAEALTSQRRPGLAARAVLRAIRVYQLLFSPMYAGSCRFVPSCSQYASEAVLKFGAGRGSWLAIRRLMRCHPFGSSGIDPVPD